MSLVADARSWTIQDHKNKDCYSTQQIATAQPIAAVYGGLLQYSKSWQIAAVQQTAVVRPIVADRGKWPQCTADYYNTANWQIVAVGPIAAVYSNVSFQFISFVEHGSQERDEQVSWLAPELERAERSKV
jgi:hypothetical protein